MSCDFTMMGTNYADSNLLLCIFVVMSILTKDNCLVTSFDTEADDFLHGASSYNETNHLQHQGADDSSNSDDMTDESDDFRSDDDIYSDNTEYEAESLSLSSLLADTICAVCRETGNNDCIDIYCTRTQFPVEE